ncbi:MAG: S-layer homology domain-containing protein [Clostridiales bacterium]|jgi:hypothetical protein|nr:S-layer homology domain-containing protein [Clostridiales bacterium]
MKKIIFTLVVATLFLALAPSNAFAATAAEVSLTISERENSRGYIEAKSNLVDPNKYENGFFYAVVDKGSLPSNWYSPASWSQSALPTNFNVIKLGQHDDENIYDQSISETLFYVTADTYDLEKNSNFTPLKSGDKVHIFLALKLKGTEQLAYSSNFVTAEVTIENSIELKSVTVQPTELNSDMYLATFKGRFDHDLKNDAFYILNKYENKFNNVMYYGYASEVNVGGTLLSPTKDTLYDTVYRQSEQRVKAGDGVIMQTYSNSRIVSTTLATVTASAMTSAPIIVTELTTPYITPKETPVPLPSNDVFFNPAANIAGQNDFLFIGADDKVYSLIEYQTDDDKFDTLADEYTPKLDNLSMIACADISSFYNSFGLFGLTGSGELYYYNREWIQVQGIGRILKVVFFMDHPTFAAGDEAGFYALSANGTAWKMFKDAAEYDAVSTGSQAISPQTVSLTPERFSEIFEDGHTTEWKLRTIPEDIYYDLRPGKTASYYEAPKPFGKAGLVEYLVITEDGKGIVKSIGSDYPMEIRDKADSILVKGKDKIIVSAPVATPSPTPSPTPAPVIAPDETIAYLYPADPGLDVFPPASALESISTAEDAAKVVSDYIKTLTEAQKTSPTGIERIERFAEEAASMVAWTTVSDHFVVDFNLVSSLDPIGSAAIKAVDEAITSNGVPRNRALRRTVRVKVMETTAYQPAASLISLGGFRLNAPTRPSASNVTFDINESYSTAEADMVIIDTAKTDLYISKGKVETGTISLQNQSATTAKIDFGSAKKSVVTVSFPGQGKANDYYSVTDDSGVNHGGIYDPASDSFKAKVNSSGTFKVASTEKEFSDLKAQETEVQKAIKALASKGVINGRSATEFEPTAKITRAEIATLLVLALKQMDPNADGKFADVKNSDWFYGAAGSSKNQGLITGYEDNTFRGGVNLPKVQIYSVSARILRNEMKYHTLNNVDDGLKGFSDARDIPQWASSDISLAAYAGLVTTRKDGKFGSDEEMTRGNAAIAVWRLYNKVF